MSGFPFGSSPSASSQFTPLPFTKPPVFFPATSTGFSWSSAPAFGSSSPSSAAAHSFGFRSSAATSAPSSWFGSSASTVSASTSPLIGSASASASSLFSSTSFTLSAPSSLFGSSSTVSSTPLFSSASSSSASTTSSFSSFSFPIASPLSKPTTTSTSTTVTPSATASTASSFSCAPPTSAVSQPSFVFSDTASSPAPISFAKPTSQSFSAPSAPLFSRVTTTSASLTPAATTTTQASLSLPAFGTLPSTSAVSSTVAKASMAAPASSAALSGTSGLTGLGLSSAAASSTGFSLLTKGSTPASSSQAQPSTIVPAFGVTTSAPVAAMTTTQTSTSPVEASTIGSQMAQQISPQKKVPQNQRKLRIKKMAQKTKSKRTYDRKAKHPDYVQFRCSVNAFNNIITDVKDKLNERQKKLLKKTPFWNLIELFYHQRIDMNNLNKSDLDLVQLLKKFDPDTKSFKFGTKSFQITGEAVTKILGLPNEGKSVKLSNDRYIATFRTRHFGAKSKPSKNKVEQELQKTISLANQPKKEKAKAEQKKKMNRGKAKKEAEEEDEEEGEDKEKKEVVDYDKEVVSLILILLCMTFLFANSSSTLHWKIVEHCVNLDTLSSFSWARAVSTYINESLITKAKAKKGGEASIGVVSGCTILILFLLCERTNIIQPILGKEKETLAILKWSLVELHTRFYQIKDLNDIEGIFKIPKRQKTTREEEDPVEKGILKTYKKRKTTREEGDPLDKAPLTSFRHETSYPITTSGPSATSDCSKLVEQSTVAPEVQTSTAISPIQPSSLDFDALDLEAQLALICGGSSSSGFTPSVKAQQAISRIKLWQAKDFAVEEGHQSVGELINNLQILAEENLIPMSIFSSGVTSAQEFQQAADLWGTIHTSLEQAITCRDVCQRSTENLEKSRSQCSAQDLELQNLKVEAQEVEAEIAKLQTQLKAIKTKEKEVRIKLQLNLRDAWELQKQITTAQPELEESHALILRGSKLRADMDAKFRVLKVILTGIVP